MNDQNTFSKPNIVLDITTLFFKIWSYKNLTGVERVTLAYLKYYHKYRCVLLINAGVIKFFIRPSATLTILQYVLNYNMHRSRITWLRFVIHILTNIRIKLNVKNGIFLNVGSQAKMISKEFLSKHHLTAFFMIHDLLPIEFSEYSNAGFAPIFKRNIEAILVNADAIILNSKDTQDKLLTYARQTNLNLPKNRVALLGFGLEERFLCNKAEPICKENNYFVVIGSIVPRKNHIMLLNIWRRLVQQGIRDIPKLIIIGGRGWRCSNVTDMLDDCTTIKDHVFELNNCKDAELQTYLKGARALLFPSFAEGYGLPLVEALQLTTPVIASDISVFHEIGGDIPEYIDPLDAISWMNMILEYAKPNSLMRAKQMERMHGYKAPTWEEHFKIADELLLDIVQK